MIIFKRLGELLPLSESFSGYIGFSVADSTPSWKDPAKPPPGAPNVVVIVLDDTGFAQLGCFGAPIDTPHIDRLANNGLRYTNFHVTPLCSPTRASLLTGRNHHAVGMGCLADFNTGFPSGSGAISHSAATIAEMLKPHGYVSYAVGKWHLTPSFSISAVGPFDQWPLGRGFDHYYGLLWGESDQYRPQLWRDNHHAETPLRPGYHVSEDFVDEAIRNISDHITAGSTNPFLMYLAFGAMHAPHQAPQEYIDKYHGRFDAGWDEVRANVLRRQIDMGVVPEGTTLPSANDDVRPWNELTADEQRLYAKMQEAFAGMMDHTDEQIGRLLDFLDREELSEDTLIVLMSDNGASGEGGPAGSRKEYRYFLRQPDSFEDNLAAIDLIGSPATHNHYPTGWAQAGNTPNKLYKKFTHAGGVRAPMVISWPSTIKSPGVREEFRHVTDIVPTLLGAVGVDAPAVMKGIAQLPVHGESFLSGLQDADRVEERRSPQYFEMIGNRAIWRDGYKAVTRHEEGADYGADRWELYDLRSDFAEVKDLAASQPELLQDLKDLWTEEAERFDVFPLDDRLQGRAGVRPPVDGEERRTFRLLPGTSPVTSQAAPDFYDRSFEIIASVDMAVGDEGVIIAQGHRANGWSFYVKSGCLVLDYNLAGWHTVLRSAPVVALGSSELRMTFEAKGVALADVRLWVGDEIVASHDGLRTIPNFFGPHSVQCGRNSPSPVGQDYDSPFEFSGQLRAVTVNLGADKGGPNPHNFAAALATE